MKITETELREIYRKETGFKYFDIPMKYMIWKKKWVASKIKELKNKSKESLRIIRDDPESYPYDNRSVQINCKRSIWV